MAERGRFAPTPSGRMHLGNVFSALLAWLSVHAAHGELVLRIEDLDTLRCSAENAEILKDDLRWLGLTWDAEQPDQSTRSEYYESILDRLRGDGFVYPCWCTRGDLKNAANAPHASDGHPIYPGTCRDLTEEERAAKAKVRAPLWRLRAPDESIAFSDGHYGPYAENLSRECGDFILRRADGVFAYQLAVVADDIDAGVTQVVRGRDLLSSTPRQLYLSTLHRRNTITSPCSPRRTDGGSPSATVILTSVFCAEGTPRRSFSARSPTPRDCWTNGNRSPPKSSSRSSTGQRSPKTILPSMYKTLAPNVPARGF